MASAWARSSRVQREQQARLEQDDRVYQASPKACAACPWRLSNQGTRNGKGWYSKANLQRLWAGLRRGERMTCHPTDPRMIDEGLQVSDGAKTTECTGSLILVQREALVFQQLCMAVESGESTTPALTAYKRATPRGLTRKGLLSLASRLLPSTRAVEIHMASPDLGDPEIGYEPLGRWKDRLP